MTSRRIAIGCGIAFAILLLLGGCGVAVAVSQLPAGERPDGDFRDPEISSARAAVVPRLEAKLDEMERRYRAGHVGSRARIDRCERGFDDFTRTDQYAYVCRMTVVELVPVGKPFEREASRLGEALLEGDCPGGTETDRALAEPHDSLGQLDPSSGDCSPGYVSPGAEIMSWLAVPADEDELDLAERLLRPSCFREFCEVDSLDLAAGAAASPPTAAALAVVAASDTYYLVGWNCPWPASWFRSVCRNESHSTVRPPGP